MTVFSVLLHVLQPLDMMHRLQEMGGIFEPLSATEPLPFLYKQQSHQAKVTENALSCETTYLPNVPVLGLLEARVIALSHAVFSLLCILPNAVLGCIAMNAKLYAIGDATAYRIARVNFVYFVTLIASLVIFVSGALLPELVYGYLKAHEWLFSCMKIVYAEKIPTAKVNDLFFEFDFLPDGGKKISAFRAEISPYLDFTARGKINLYRENFSRGFYNYLLTHYTQQEAITSLKVTDHILFFPELPLENDDYQVASFLKPLIQKIQKQFSDEGLLCIEDMQDIILGHEPLLASLLLALIDEAEINEHHVSVSYVHDGERFSCIIPYNSCFRGIYALVKRFHPLIKNETFTLEKNESLKMLLCKIDTEERLWNERYEKADPQVKSLYDMMSSSIVHLGNNLRQNGIEVSHVMD